MEHPPPAFGRRQFLVGAGSAGMLLALAGCGGTDDSSSSDLAPRPSTLIGSGRATPVLIPTGDLALPAGFSYAQLSTTANDDADMPPAPDGMATFSMPDGTIRLVLNHERGDAPGAAMVLDDATAYDLAAPGGTTTVVIAADSRSLVSQHTSLSGTLRNCAGGATPWGSWLSCEETTEGVAQGWQREHGYVFEVAASANSPVIATPLVAMGRFLHEAVAVDSVTGIVYLTEDNGYDSGLYRFKPVTAGNLAAGGTLEMLAVRDSRGHDTAFGQSVGARLPVTWVPIADPDPSDAHTNTSAVFNQGFHLGGARFKRLEGCCLAASTLFVSATEGGDAGLGQVWALGVTSDELTLVYEAAEPTALFGPDNLTAAPGSSGIVIGEDNGNGEANRLQMLRPDGSLIVFAENVADTTEFTGPCFSPDGSTLFVNVFGDEATGIPGRTLAIWGPWESLA